MQRYDIGTSFGGGLSTVKYTLTAIDLAVGTTTAPLTISLPLDPGGNAVQQPSATATPNQANFTIPRYGGIEKCTIRASQAFSGGSTTSLTVSVGKLGGSATYIAGAFDIFQPVGDTILQETFAIPSGQVSAWGVTLTFTGDGVHNLNVYTTGSVDIVLSYINVSTQN